MFRSELAGEYWRREKGYPVLSNHPEWVYKLAYRLQDPQGLNSGEYRAAIVNLCRVMLDEFGSGDPYFASTLASRRGVPDFISQVAKALVEQ